MSSSGHHVPWSGRRGIGQAAETELQRMAPCLLHLLPSPRRLLRLEHVRRGGCGELPPMQSRAGEGGASAKSGQESEEDRGEETK